MDSEETLYAMFLAQIAWKTERKNKQKSGCGTCVKIINAWESKVCVDVVDLI